jgi:hypothetical protein
LCKIIKSAEIVTLGQNKNLLFVITVYAALNAIDLGQTKTDNINQMTFTMTFTIIYIYKRLRPRKKNTQQKKERTTKTIFFNDPLKLIKKIR